LFKILFSMLIINFVQTNSLPLVHRLQMSSLSHSLSRSILHPYLCGWHHRSFLHWKWKLSFLSTNLPLPHPSPPFLTDFLVIFIIVNSDTISITDAFHQSPNTRNTASVTQDKKNSSKGTNNKVDISMNYVHVCY